jgi:hypothetical protein
MHYHLGSEVMPGAHGNGCSCEHDLSQPMDGTEWLDKWIDFDNMETINVLEGTRISSIFRPYSERLNDPLIPCEYHEDEFDDDDDSQDTGIVIVVPFTSPVKLTGLCIIGGPNGRSPNRVDLYSNLQSIDSVCEVTPSQIIDSLVEDFCGVIEYPLRPVRFSQVTRLAIRFPRQDNCQLFWIGIKGIASGDQRKAVVTVYESRPNLSDHQVTETNKMSSRHVS